MSPHTWGLIGFGEVATHFAKQLRASGEQVQVYARAPNTVKDQAEHLGIQLTPDLATLIRGANVVISCVWATAAEDVARQTAKAGIDISYVDVTNAGIAATQRMTETLPGFHKAAILAPVMRHGASAPMLLAGPTANELAEAFNRHGFNVRAVGAEPRQAAAIKILRSVATKCIVALLHDMETAAAHYGVADQVLESAGEFFATEPFADLARTLLRQSAVHAERLAGEMDEIAEALRLAGVPERAPALAKQVFQEIARQQAAMRK